MAARTGNHKGCPYVRKRGQPSLSPATTKRQPLPSYWNCSAPCVPQCFLPIVCSAARNLSNRAELPFARSAGKAFNRGQARIVNVAVFRLLLSRRRNFLTRFVLVAARASRTSTWPGVMGSIRETCARPFSI